MYLTPPNRKIMSYAVTHKGRSTAPVLATQQWAGPYRHSTGHNLRKYCTNAGKPALATKC